MAKSKKSIIGKSHVVPMQKIILIFVGTKEIFKDISIT